MNRAKQSKPLIFSESGATLAYLWPAPVVVCRTQANHAQLRDDFDQTRSVDQIRAALTSARTWPVRRLKAMVGQRWPTVADSGANFGPGKRGTSANSLASQVSLRPTFARESSPICELSQERIGPNELVHLGGRVGDFEQVWTEFDPTRPGIVPIRAEFEPFWAQVGHLEIGQVWPAFG